MHESKISLISNSYSLYSYLVIIKKNGQQHNHQAYIEILKKKFLYHAISSVLQNGHLGI